VVRAHLTAPIRVRLTGSAGWRGVAQRVAVRPWSKYIIRLTGDWSNANAYIGAHGIADVNVVNTNIDSVTPINTCAGVTWPTTPLAQQSLSTYGSGSRTLVFNTGPYSLVAERVNAFETRST